MSIELMSTVFRLPQTVSATDKILLLALTDFANSEGNSVYPSVDTLSERTSLTTRCIKSRMAGWRESGLLLVVESSTNKHPFKYQINVEELKSLGCMTFTPTANGGECGSPLGVNTVHPKHDSRGEYGSPNPPSTSSIHHSSTIGEHATTRKKETFNLPEWLVSLDGFSSDLWDAWMDTRKKHRATNSTTAISLLIKKLSSRRDDAVAAIEMAVEYGWRGIEWEWFDNRRQPFGRDVAHGERPSLGNGGAK